jgi:hypothetical protein
MNETSGWARAIVTARRTVVAAILIAIAVSGKVSLRDILLKDLSGFGDDRSSFVDFAGAEWAWTDLMADEALRFWLSSSFLVTSSSRSTADLRSLKSTLSDWRGGDQRAGSESKQECSDGGERGCGESNCVDDWSVRFSQVK